MLVPCRRFLLRLHRNEGAGSPFTDEGTAYLEKQETTNKKTYRNFLVVAVTSCQRAFGT